MMAGWAYSFSMVQLFSKTRSSFLTPAVSLGGSRSCQPGRHIRQASGAQQPDMHAPAVNLQGRQKQTCNQTTCSFPLRHPQPAFACFLGCTPHMCDGECTGMLKVEDVARICRRLDRCGDVTSEVVVVHLPLLRCVDAAQLEVAPC